MRFQKRRVESMTVWFGSGFIYARLNLNQYIGLGKKEQPPLLFSFPQLRLNTEFEHKSMNTVGSHWQLKRVGAELCSDLCS